MLTTEQMWAEIDRIFSNPGLVKGWRDKPPEKALQGARDYLKWADERLTQASGDFTYWAYKGDETLAILSICIFEQQVAGRTEWPELPPVGDFTVAETLRDLQDWAGNIVAGHEHNWVLCVHERDKPPSVSACSTVHDYGALHSACDICGMDRNDRPKVCDERR